MYRAAHCARPAYGGIRIPGDHAIHDRGRQDDAAAVASVLARLIVLEEAAASPVVGRQAFQGEGAWLTRAERHTERRTAPPNMPNIRGHQHKLHPRRKHTDTPTHEQTNTPRHQRMALR